MKYITVKSKNRDFSNSPLRVRCDREGIFTLSGGRQKNFYGQADKNADGDKHLVCIPPVIPAGVETKFELEETGKAPPLVKLNNKESGCVDIFINETFFACYNYATPGIARPFLFPVTGVGNTSVLRTPAEKGNPEKVDHPHHKGIWVSHGDVNGIDNWSEEEEGGKTVHKNFLELTSGPVFARIHAVSDWVKEGFFETSEKTAGKIMEEERIITIYNMPSDCRIIDQKLILRATEGEVVFKDTKESGLLSIRVSPSMEERRGGIMVNANGGRGERECWGQRASWCDYSGEVEGVRCGIAVFDSPDNLRYPTWWHIRGYGLFTANFFGISEFTGDKKKSGTYILPEGEELKLSYRIYIHAGDAEKGNVSEKFLNYIYPPDTAVE